MIFFILKNHEFEYEIQTTIQIFYPNRHYYRVNEISKEYITIQSALFKDFSEAVVYENGSEICRRKSEFLYEGEKEKKRVLCMAVFEALQFCTGYKPPWGMLTGIRPAKLVNNIIDSGKTEKDAFLYMRNMFFVSKSKAELAILVAQEERKLLKNSLEDSMGLYIGIPFCPTRCLYCSFAAYPLSQYKKKVDEYLDILLKELDFLSLYLKNFKLENIYIGGGTPTSLNECQLERLLKFVRSNFQFEHVKEFTVEAGRPDTLNYEKLMLLKQYGVSRISINPQTMNQNTLHIIGREHTVDDTINAFYMARRTGHQNINMDLILGLPDETEKEVKNTFESIKKLSPESLTVHTLSVKRASRLKEDFDKYSLVQAVHIEKMLDISYSYSKEMDMKPYYMYRQKNMLGSFENIGYCKTGYESIYNIKIMEECQTILGAGVGATTKIVTGEKIERVFNVKSIEEYIARIDEMLERKKTKLI